MSDAFAANHLDGPKLIAWLKERRSLPKTGLSSFVGGRWECQVRRWEKGRALNVQTADEFLLAIDVALGEVPEGIYRESPARGGSPLTDAEKQRIVDLHREQVSAPEIARRVGRDHKTVRRHLAKAAA